MSSNKIRIVSDDGICSIVSKQLHRYQKIDSNLFDSLIYNYLWFSNPADFNDPYDCNLCFDFENTPGEIREFAQEINNAPHNAHLK